MPSRSGSHQHEMLEVEDVEQRQRRLQDILERLNGEGSSAEQPPNLSFDFGVRRTFAIEPPAELLTRVREFLPQIEQSNVELLQRDPRNIDIEHIEETDEHVVEMNLGLGVFEQRPAGRSYSISSSSSSSSGSLSSVTSDSSSTLSDSDSSSDSEDDRDANRDGSSGSPRLRPIRPLPKRQSPMIQVLAPRDEELEVSSESAGDCSAP